MLLARVVVPALITGSSVGDLAGLRDTMTLLIAGATFLAGALTGVVAVLPGVRRGARVATSIRALVAICLVFGTAIGAAWVLHEPVPLGTLMVHAIATVGGLTAGVAGGTIARTARPGPPTAPALMAIVLLAVTGLPASAAAAANGDYGTDQCVLTTLSASIEGGGSAGPVDAALSFTYEATEHPNDRWEVDLTVGFELDVSHDFVPAPVALAAKATGNELELKVGGRGIVRIVNNYRFPSRKAMELAVVSAFARVTNDLIGFPALTKLLPAEAPPGALPPAQSSELRFATGGFASIGLKVAGFVGLDVRIQNATGVRLRLFDDDGHRSDLAVTPGTATSFDIGLESSFGLSGKGKVIALVPGIMVTGAGLATEFRSYSFLHFDPPTPEDSIAFAPLGYVPTSLTMETTGDATATGVLRELLGPKADLTSLGLSFGTELAGRSGLSFELTAELTNLSRLETLTSLRTLFQAIASVVRDDAGRPLANAPSPIDLGTALRVIQRESAVRLSAARADGLGIDVEAAVGTLATLSGDAEVSASRLAWAAYVNRSGSVVRSVACRPGP